MLSSPRPALLVSEESHPLLRLRHSDGVVFGHLMLIVGVVVLQPDTAAW